MNCNSQKLVWGKRVLKIINFKNTPNVYNIQIIISHKRANVVCFHLYEVLRAIKFIETENRTVVAKDWGQGEVGSYGTSLMVQTSLWEDEKVVEMDGGNEGALWQ